MNTLVPSLIRTYVPILVGALVSWLVSLGVTVDDAASTALTTGIGALAAAIYYAAVRWLELKFPWVGVFLGSTQSPDSYSKTPAGSVDTTSIPAGGVNADGELDDAPAA